MGMRYYLNEASKLTRQLGSQHDACPEHITHHTTIPFSLRPRFLFLTSSLPILLLPVLGDLPSMRQASTLAAYIHPGEPLTSECFQAYCGACPNFTASAMAKRQNMPNLLTPTPKISFIIRHRSLKTRPILRDRFWTPERSAARAAAGFNC